MNDTTNMNSPRAARLKGLGIGLLVGAAIGGAVSLLTTPRAGWENRRLISSRAARAKDRIVLRAKEEYRETRQRLEHPHKLAKR